MMDCTMLIGLNIDDSACGAWSSPLVMLFISFSNFNAKDDIMS